MVLPIQSASVPVSGPKTGSVNRLVNAQPVGCQLGISNIFKFKRILFEVLKISLEPSYTL
jgi:hypothetical protein